ncbi:MAG: cobalamin-dependent protein [Firmicutes bacterium]|nr:cobalamin-dependent protein [Bacillota bacterium]
MEESIKKLTEAIMDGDDEVSAEAAQEIVDAKADLKPVIEKLTDTMRELGRQFEAMEIFLPEMILSADAMVAAMDIFGPVLAESGDIQKKGTVVLGTAPGDMHEIGKNIVVTVLTADGFDVVDLGKNVPAIDYVNKAVENEADVIGVSALMTTTMPGATEVINLLRDKDLYGKFKVIVGGAPTNPNWAKDIGADGWAESAAEAVTLVNNLVQK